MAALHLHFQNFSNARNVQLGQQTVNLIAGNQYLSDGNDHILRLNPITDASHTRNLATSPPDSVCFPGTRRGVIKGISSWANTRIVFGRRAAHIYWFHGFAGSGKSAISLEIARIYARSGRLLASYFFFRNAGDRSRMNRFAVTLASQLAAAVPAAAPFIESAIRAEPGLLTDSVSLSTQLEQLVYRPFQAAMKGALFLKTTAKGPFLLVIDGLDECEDKRGVEEFITHALDFFKRYPSIPLRIFIASRVEQHIHAHIKHAEGVVIKHLDDRSPLAASDVRRFLEASFQLAAKQNPIIQAYIHSHGSWPTPSDMDKLILHVGGSFILASTIFKFIVQPPTEEDFMTPMDRFPLTLEMNGLDSVYTQTLARSQHLPHFSEIISCIAFASKSLSIVDISALLGIEAFEVVQVLLNLQAIIRIPGTDELGTVVLSHKSLRDFLTTESRSGPFYVPPSFHLRFAYYVFCYCSDESNKGQVPEYSRFHRHWESFSTSEACDFVNGIEQFKACQPRHRSGLPRSAFLCTMSFYSLFIQKYSHSDSYLFIECAKQLALVAECDSMALPQAEQWLRNSIFVYLVHEIQQNIPLFTEDTCKTLEGYLQQASTAIRTNFPGILERQPPSTGQESFIDVTIIRGFFSGIMIFNVLSWVVARAQYIWGEMRITPCPPLGLSMVFNLRNHERKMFFSLTSYNPNLYHW